VKREKSEGERDEEKEAYRRFLLANGGGEEQVRELLGLGDEDEGKDEVSDDGEDVAMQAQAEAPSTSGEALARKEKTARQKKDDDAFLMK
jgi:protein KRI1